MILTHKERLLRVLRHQPVDRLPTQINYTAGMGRLLAAHYGVSAGALPVVLDNHLVRVDVSHPERLSADGLARFDWWGAGHDTAEEGYYIRVCPLAESKNLDAFPWPDPHAPDLLAGTGAYHRGARAVNTSSRPTSASPCSNGRGRCAGSSSSSWTWCSILDSPPSCSTASPRSNSS